MRCHRSLIAGCCCLLLWWFVIVGIAVVVVVIACVRCCGSGKVRAAFHRDSGLQVAVKIVDKANMKASSTMQRKLEREIAVMKLVTHPNVLQLFEVFETDEHLYVNAVPLVLVLVLVLVLHSDLARGETWSIDKY
jgi:serine/threonine protein kinase